MCCSLQFATLTMSGACTVSRLRAAADPVVLVLVTVAFIGVEFFAVAVVAVVDVVVRVLEA